MRRSNRSVGGGITPSRSRSQQRRSYNTPSVATKRTASADAPSSSSIIKRTSSADPAVPIKRKRRSSPAPQTSQPQKPKLTMPHTPRVLRYGNIYSVCLCYSLIHLPCEIDVSGQLQMNGCNTHLVLLVCQAYCMCRLEHIQMAHDLSLRFTK